MASNKNFKTLFTCAISHHQKNNLHEARNIYKSILENYPESFEILFLLGTVNLQIKNFSESVEYLKKAIIHNNFVHEAFFNLALAHEKLGEFEESIKNYRHASILKPDYVEAHINCGNLLQSLLRYQEAIKQYDDLILSNSTCKEAYNNRGNALQALHRFEEALISFDKALSLDPTYAEAYNNRGNIFKNLGQISEAQNNYSRALSINPKFLPAMYNSAVNSFDRGDLNNAIKLYQQLIAIDPDHADGNWNLSICYLMAGNYELGWSQYEYRWETPNAPFFKNKRSYNVPMWTGKESIQNKTIFIYFEQGYGDTIQFCRYLLLLNQLGANVIFQIQKPLLKLLKSLGETIDLIPDDQNPPNFDYYCPLLSLPFAFQTRLENIPKYRSYLSPHQDKVIYWKHKLGPKHKFRIGVVWSSTSNFKDDIKRSMLFEQFCKLFPDNFNSFEFICLQKEIKLCDRESFFSVNSIKFFGSELEDFSDTAGLISQLDLVISTCTSIPHLSGAMGIPTWILLSHVPDWRWLMQRPDSPWYPSAVLYRQKIPGDWNDVLFKIKNALSKLKYDSLNTISPL